MSPSGHKGSVPWGCLEFRCFGGGGEKEKEWERSSGRFASAPPPENQVATAPHANRTTSSSLEDSA